MEFNHFKQVLVCCLLSVDVLRLVYSWSYNNVAPRPPTTLVVRVAPNNVAPLAVFSGGTLWNVVAVNNVAPLAVFSGGTLWNVVAVNNVAPPAAPTHNTCSMYGP